MRERELEDELEIPQLVERTEREIDELYKKSMNVDADVPESEIDQNA